MALETIALTLLHNYKSQPVELVSSADKGEGSGADALGGLHFLSEIRRAFGLHDETKS